MDKYKLGADEKEVVLQSLIERSFDIPVQQTSRPKPSLLLELKRQKDKEKVRKDSVEQKTTEKKDVFLLLDNNEENTTNGISSPIKKEETTAATAATLQYNPLNTDDNLIIDYYRKISQPLIQLFLDSLKLQKDYINAFQPQWVEYTRTRVENYLIFQNKMIFLYIQNYNAYLKNVFDIKKLKLKLKELQQQVKELQQQVKEKNGEIRGIEKTKTYLS